MKPVSRPPGVHVSVCDDDPVIREVFRAWFQRAGVSFELFETAKGLLGSAAEVPFDLHIIDHDLGPDLKGPELVEQLRESSPAAIVVLSGFAPSDIRTKYPDHAGLRVAEKPVSFDDLLAWLGRDPEPSGGRASRRDGHAPIDLEQFEEIVRSMSPKIAREIGCACYESVLDTVATLLPELEDPCVDPDPDQWLHLIDRAWGGALSVGATSLAATLAAVRDELRARWPPRAELELHLRAIELAAHDYRAVMAARGHGF